MQQQNTNFDQKLQFIENYLLNLYDYSEQERRMLKIKIATLKTNFKQRWMLANRKMDKFRLDNNIWLQGTFEIPKSTKQPGRPVVAFEESSERSKRRKTEYLRKNANLEELSYATQSSYFLSGKRNAAKIVKELTASPKRASRYRQAFYRKPEKTVHTLTPFEALAMIVEADLSRKQYEVIRNTNKSIYPCYSLIQKAKLECYPQKETYIVTERGL